MPEQLLEQLPDYYLRQLKELGRVAEGSSTELYLVGGLVRDLILKRRQAELDVDLMLYPQHSALLEFFRDKQLVNQSGFEEVSSVHEFKKYFTAKVIFKAGAIPSLDISGARTESYAGVASNPKTRAGSVQEDLARRDFSLNAIAVSLNSSSFAEIIDPFLGVEDLARGELRILHQRSFYDDPVRLIRGARFIGRFGFSYEAKTKEAVSDATNEKLLFKVKRRRLLDELRKAVFDERFLEALPELERVGLFAAIGINQGEFEADELRDKSDHYLVLAFILKKAGLIEELSSNPSDFPFSKEERETIASAL